MHRVSKNLGSLHKPELSLKQPHCLFIMGKNKAPFAHVRPGRLCPSQQRTGRGARMVTPQPKQLPFPTSLPGSLNVYLRLKGQTAMDNPLWSSSGNKGQHWNQARVNINPPTSFQVTARARRAEPRHFASRVFHGRCGLSTCTGLSVHWSTVMQTLVL